MSGTSPTFRCRLNVFCKLIDGAVEQAVALDAAAIVVNLLWASDQPDLHRQCTENVIRLKPQCERYGMPMMVEPLVMIPGWPGRVQNQSRHPQDRGAGAAIGGVRRGHR